MAVICVCIWCDVMWAIFGGMVAVRMNDKPDDAGGNMSGKTSSNKVEQLDLTGLKCPLPVLKARRHITQMAVGAMLEVSADDPAAPLDFDHFCHTGGHHLIETRTAGDVFTFCIQVGSPSTN